MTNAADASAVSAAESVTVASEAEAAAASIGIVPAARSTAELIQAAEAVFTEAPKGISAGRDAELR